MVGNPWWFVLYRGNVAQVPWTCA